MIRECRLTNFIILSLSFSLDFLECTGGTLSMIQVVCDSWNMHDITGITGDLAKFALGFATILFDVSWFIVRILVVYFCWNFWFFMNCN